MFKLIGIIMSLAFSFALGGLFAAYQAFKLCFKPVEELTEIETFVLYQVDNMLMEDDV